MIVSEMPNRLRSRWLRACVLLTALCLMPVGAARAQNPDYEAVSARLEAAVQAGELTADQAGAMMGELARASFAERMGAHHEDGPESVGARLKEAGERIKTAAEAGKLTEKEAWAKWREIKERIIKGAVATGEISGEEAGAIWREVEKAETGERLKAAVAKGEMTEKQARAKWAEINRGHDKGNRAAHLETTWKQLQAMVKAGKLTEEEAHAKMAAIKKQAARPAKDDQRGEGIAGHYKKIGISAEMLGRIKKALADNGIRPEQMEEALGGLGRVVHEMKSEGEEFELDPRLREYFENDVGLTAKKIEILQGLARRLLQGLGESSRRKNGAAPTKDDKRDGGIAGHYKRMGISAEALGRIKKVLADNGIKPEQIEGTLGGMIRLIHGMKSEGDDFAPNSRLGDYFKKQVGLTDAQIEQVLGLARRIAHGLRERSERDPNARSEDGPAISAAST